MATVIGGARAGARRDPFYPLMALGIAAIVAAGFVPSYTRSLAPPGLPVWVHVHGAVMTAWILLFAGQSWLVRLRALAWHRRLGWASTGLVAAMLPLGVATDILAVRRGATPPFFMPAQMIATDWVDLVVFAGLFVAAVAMRRQPDWHKRLLLGATVLLSFPGIGRLAILRPLGLHGIIPAATVLLVLLALAGPLHDRVRRGRVHPAYWWTVGAVLVAQPVHAAVAASAPMQRVAAWAEAGGNRHGS